MVIKRVAQNCGAATITLMTDACDVFQSVRGCGGASTQGAMVPQLSRDGPQSSAGVCVCVCGGGGGGSVCVKVGDSVCVGGEGFCLC